MGLFKKSANGGDGAHASQPKGNSSALDAPWVRAGMAHNDTFLRLAAQVANWRTFAFICAGITALAIVGVIYIGSQSKFVPMLIEVDKLGRTVAVRALSGDDAVKDSKRLVYRELFDLIEYLRTVSTDVGANNANLEKGFSRLTGAASGYVRTELRKAPPNEVGASRTVQVQVKTALPISENTWQVEWEEHSFNLKGEELGVEKWKATVGFKLSPPDNEAGIRKNPIGFLVSEISWMKVI